MPRRSPTTRTLTATLAVLALLAQGCMGGDEFDEQPLAPTGRTDAAAEAPEDPEPSDEPSPSPSPSPTPTEVTADTLDHPSGVHPDLVRGVYSTAYSFWGERFEVLLDLVETTEVNALVIDVKDEAGTLLWDLDHPLAEAGGGGRWLPGSDPRERLQRLIEAGGYPIARVACFKDTAVADARPDLAVQDASGNRWQARSGFGWLNPYQEEVWDWCTDVAVAAIEAGFAEVQFDYMRFPNGGDGNTDGIRFPGVPADRPEEHWRHPEQITGFTARAAEAVHAAGGLVSTDLFGLVTYDFSWNAQGTGQIIEQIAEHVDYISPMVYPSHYGPGNYGLDPHPVDHAYETVWNAMQEAQMRVQDLRAKIRPWLEDFSPVWMGRSHSPERLREQKQAVYENGIDGWMLWNARNVFSVEALEPGPAESRADPDFVPPYRTADPDGAPGEEERKWPGRPPCTPDREKLFIGKGNLAGSTPPVRAPGRGEEIACKPEPGASASPDGSGSDEPSEAAETTEDGT